MEILKKILSDKSNRSFLIKQFQEQIWNEENSNDILCNLAYDLDFYEPNERLREEDAVYYGDEKLEVEIVTVLNKLNCV